VVSEPARTSVSRLHKRWTKLENEHHKLADSMKEAKLRGADLAFLREKQAKLLLEINALVSKIRETPASTLEDYLALLDVALEHEIDLAADIAMYGPSDYPLITRLLRALAEQAPDFEFNSLRRWLSLPGQFEELLGRSRSAGSRHRRTVASKRSAAAARRSRPKTA
jgi:hypothetical protein